MQLLSSLFGVSVLLTASLARPILGNEDVGSSLDPFCTGDCPTPHAQIISRPDTDSESDVSGDGRSVTTSTATYETDASSIDLSGYDLEHDRNDDIRITKDGVTLHIEPSKATPREEAKWIRGLAGADYPVHVVEFWAKNTGYPMPLQGDEAGRQWANNVLDRNPRHPITMFQLDPIFHDAEFREAYNLGVKAIVASRPAEPEKTSLTERFLNYLRLQ